MSSVKIVFIAVVLDVFFVFASVSHAAVINAASPSYSDVSAAISSASSGDTVIVPAGNATWTSRLLISKRLALRGAGAGKTVITSNYPSISGNTFDQGNYLIDCVFTDGSSALFQISGFTFDFNNNCGGIYLSSCDKVRIDHNELKNATSAKYTARAIIICGTVYGVIDNNVFSGNADNIACYGDGLNSWNNSTFAFGTADNLYIEDNTFYLTNTGGSGGNGSRYCARYNTYIYNNTVGLFPWFDMHGNMGVGGNYSMMGAEIYGNLLTMPVNHNVGIFDQRGGKAMIFNNEVVTTASCSSKAREEYNDSLNPTNYGSGAADGEPQHVSDSYYWNNRQNSNLVLAGAENTTGVAYPLTENVDFFNQAVNFAGTTGIGVGPLSARPVNCTPGTGYWATDQSTTDLTGMVGAHPATPITGTFYKCTAPNIWTEYYKPFPYPHPLRGIIPDLFTKYDHDAGWVLDTGKYTYLNKSSLNIETKILNVEQDGTISLISEPSKDLVETTEGSYYWDPSTGKLYMHCSTGANPGNHLIVVNYQ